MPSFSYTALDRAGRRTSGQVSAGSRDTAVDQMTGLGLFPVEVREGAGAETTRNSELGTRSAERGRVSRAAVEAFTRELANLLEAGVSLSRALRLLGREAAHPAARRVWSSIHDAVAEGAALADALARWPAVFPAVHVAMVRAGEHGGFLETVLNQIADLQVRERDLKGKVKAALVYPCVLAALATGVLVFLLTYFIPRFEGIFADFGGSLPPLTRAIVAVSEGVRDYGAYAAIAVVLLVLLGRRALSGEAGRRQMERWLLATPAVGRVVARLALVRFCRMLGTLIGAGVPLVAALRVAREALGHQLLADAVERAIEDVRGGRGLARSLSGCGPPAKTSRGGRLFPASVIEMIAVAEETGRLDTELVRLASSYESELDRRLRMLVALAEPAMLLVMAAVIGLIVVGMLLPLFMLQDLIQ